jgi:uncharacterized membrane protein YbhN (UPF0104 family)
MAYALRGIEWGTFRDLLARADWAWWACGLAVGMGLQVVGGIRWAVLARPLGFPLSYGAFVWRFLEGSFFSLCLPSSIGGDVVKAYRLVTPRPGDCSPPVRCWPTGSRASPRSASSP